MTFLQENNIYLGALVYQVWLSVLTSLFPAGRRHSELGFTGPR